jgi:hypothetical protein
VVFPAMLHKEPRVSNAASWKSGAGMSRTPWLECWSSGLTSWGSNLKPSTMIPSSGGRSAQAQGIGEDARQGARSGYSATGPVGGVTGGIAGDTPLQILQSSLLPPPPVLTKRVSPSPGALQLLLQDPVLGNQILIPQQQFLIPGPSKVRQDAYPRSGPRIDRRRVTKDNQ